VPIGIVIGANERIHRSAEFIMIFPFDAGDCHVFVHADRSGRPQDRTRRVFALLLIVFNAYGVLNVRKTRILAACSWAPDAVHLCRRNFPETRNACRLCAGIR
jgi:hypothetical protein